MSADTVASDAASPAERRHQIGGLASKHTNAGTCARLDRRRSPRARWIVCPREAEVASANIGPPSSSVHDLELGCAVDRGADRAVDRTAGHVMLECALDSRTVYVMVDPEEIPHVDPFDHEHAVLGLDLTRRLAD